MPLRRAIFDAHADTAVFPELDGKSNQLRVSDIYSYDRYIQVFAVCTEHFDPKPYAIEKTDEFLKKLKGEKLRLVLNRKDMNYKYCAVLALEGADAFDKLSAPEFFYKKGVRLVTLCWNTENLIASNCFSEKDEGLKPFGREVVKELEKLGIVTDLSHISDRAFYDVLEITQKPLIASHSNSRALFNHPRNMTDDMFMRLADRRGCVGVTFEPDFMGGKKDITSVIQNIEHFCALDKKCVGLGSDFDGISRFPNGIEGARSMESIGEELLKLNYSEEDTCGILFNNFFRVFYEIL